MLGELRPKVGGQDSGARDASKHCRLELGRPGQELSICMVLLVVTVEALSTYFENHCKNAEDGEGDNVTDKMHDGPNWQA
jgi:hypothetical protein